MHPHFSGDVSQYSVPVFQLYAKHRIGESLSHRAGHFYDIFFWHVSVRLPVLV